MKIEYPTTPLKKRAVIRNVLSRIYINNDGTYFLKPFLSEQKKHQ